MKFIYPVNAACQGSKGDDVGIMDTHWLPFVERLEKYGLDIKKLRVEWK